MHVVVASCRRRETRSPPSVISRMTAADALIVFIIHKWRQIKGGRTWHTHTLTRCLRLIDERPVTTDYKTDERGLSSTRCIVGLQVTIRTLCLVKNCFLSHLIGNFFYRQNNWQRKGRWFMKFQIQRIGVNPGGWGGHDPQILGFGRGVRRGSLDHAGCSRASITLYNAKKHDMRKLSK